jgi:FlaA1/EpsC-like NDP-sugar epimerase
MHIEDAVDLVRIAFEQGKSGELFIHNPRAFRLGDIVDALKEFFGADNMVLVRGARHGERMYEYLLTDEESHYATDYGNFIKIDLSFNAERKPCGIPHFNSSSTDRVLGPVCARQEIKVLAKQYC